MRESCNCLIYLVSSFLRKRKVKKGSVNISYIGRGRGDALTQIAALLTRKKIRG